MSLRKRLLGARSITSGALLYVVMRWFDRAVGAISTIVLARLLTPDDFGLVALATVVIGLASMMLDLGVPIRLVQMGEIDETDIDTGWTIQLVEFLMIAGVLAALAPSISAFYGDPRLKLVLQIQALSMCLAGLSNMSAVLFQRRREYAREVTFFMSRRMATFLVTLALAIYLRNYWALIVGSLFGTLFGVALSYWMSPTIRRPTFRRWRRFASASIWLTAWSMGRYASEQVDKLFVGKIAGSSNLGAYTLADQVAAMPSSELLLPMNRAIFPALSQKQHLPEEFRRIFLSGLGVQAMVAVPASIGLALVSPEAVRVLLGEKWLVAVPLLTVLALSYGLSGVSSGFNYLLIAMGRFRDQASVYWGNFLVLAGSLFALSDRLDVNSVALVRLVTSVLFSIALITVALLGTNAVDFRACLKAVWRSVVAAGIMAACVAAIGMAGGSMHPAILLATKILAGALAYTGALALLWRLSGCPEGAERWVLALLRRSFSRA